MDFLSELINSFLELEVRREDVIHQVVEVAPLNQPLALVARIHGLPAQFLVWVWALSLHEVPHRAAHHRHWCQIRKIEQLSNFINFDPLTHELT